MHGCIYTCKESHTAKQHIHRNKKKKEWATAQIFCFQIRLYVYTYFKHLSSSITNHHGNLYIPVCCLVPFVKLSIHQSNIYVISDITWYNKTMKKSLKKVFLT